MGKNTFGKILCMPFLFCAIPFLGVALLIRYGMEDSTYILEKFADALKEKNKVTEQ